MHRGCVRIRQLLTSCQSATGDVTDWLFTVNELQAPPDTPPPHLTPLTLPYPAPYMFRGLDLMLGDRILFVSCLTFHSPSDCNAGTMPDALTSFTRAGCLPATPWQGLANGSLRLRGVEKRDSPAQTQLASLESDWRPAG